MTTGRESGVDSPASRLRSILTKTKQLVKNLGRLPLAPLLKPRSATYLFVAINGAGLGHLTRCLAVARRIKQVDPNSDVLFFSTSVAVPIIVEAGFYAYHVPPAASLNDAGYSSADWNFIFSRQLDAVMSLHRPSRVVFDGTYPYPGLQMVMMKYRRVRWIWMRRGSSRQTKVLSQADQLVRKFQLVIVPGEVTGSPASVQNNMVPVPPILLLDRSELMDVDAARSALELDGDRPAVYVQLGAGVINDIADLQTKVMAALRSQIPEVQIVLGRSPIALSGRETGADLTIVSYPNSRYYKAFDLLVLAAGYNSVVEAFVFQSRAIFFPNTSTGSDDQVSRAKSLSALGGWRVMLEWDEAEFARQVRDLLESEVTLPPTGWDDGAARAAELIIDQERKTAG